MCPGGGEGGHAEAGPVPRPRQVRHRQEEASAPQDQHTGKAAHFLLRLEEASGVAPSPPSAMVFVSRLARAWRLGLRVSPSEAAPLASPLARLPRGEGNPRGRAVAPLPAVGAAVLWAISDWRISASKPGVGRPQRRGLSLGPCARCRPGRTGQPVANYQCLAFVCCVGEGGAKSEGKSSPKPRRSEGKERFGRRRRAICDAGRG
ncbi:uncharacterized protein LOC125048270 [Penaeus chinensis]|uniref:uncharacterized protein LOC125048270 n=1 Tax=Penaeus chinensis TaxID=139456 RepID=UPI001FB72A9C|nr:uncharacterized protein LOC125048270 [Penaeus chinensis]